MTPDVTTRSAVPYALQNFDSLPDSALVRVKTVAALFGCCARTVTRRSAAGHLPKATRVSAGVIAWRVGDLRAALKALPATTEAA